VSETEAARPRTVAHKRALTATERAIDKLLSEIRAGLRHGFFEYTIHCEVVSAGLRRVRLMAGKTYQFVIPTEECETGNAA
jgi:hypothetical protein